MILSRRDAIRIVGGGSLALTVPGITGCSYTKQDLITDAGIVDTTVSAILTALGQTGLATEIQGYLTQFDTAVTNWTGGSTGAVIVSVLQDLELALGDSGLPIALTAPADAIIAAIELLIQNLSKGAPAAALAIQPRASVQHTVRAKPAAATSRKAATRGWNKAIVGTPLESHKVREPMF